MERALKSRKGDAKISMEERKLSIRRRGLSTAYPGNLTQLEPQNSLVYGKTIEIPTFISSGATRGLKKLQLK